MEKILFDEHGYTAAEDLCAPLGDRDSEKPGGWIRRMALLALNKIEMCQLTAKQNLEEAKKSGYDVISHKPQGNARTVAYDANKIGLQKLAEAAIRAGKKVDEAKDLLSRLSAAEIEEPKPDNADVMGVLSLSPRAETFKTISDLKEQGAKVYNWKSKNVMQASDFAAACGLPPKYVNRQIRTYANNGELVENEDFFKLDDRATAGFCGVYDLHPPTSELTNGIYLLTQMGAIKLVSHFRNSKAAAMKESVNLAASVIMDIESGRCEHVKSVPAIIRGLTELYHLISEERALLREENRIFSHQLELVLRKNPEELARQVALATAKEYISGVTYDGEESIPKHLIGREERRNKHFPGIAHDIVNEFLIWKGHPSENWMHKMAEGLHLTPSYVRTGMETLSMEFFRLLKFIGETDCYYVFELPMEIFKKKDSNRVRVKKKKTEHGASAAEVERELSHFLEKFCRAHNYTSFKKDVLLSTAR